MKNVGEDGAKQPTPAKLFATTHWSVVLRAKDDSFTALDTLFNRYRKPMIVHLLGKGYAFDRAEDLVHGFFEYWLTRKFLANVASEKGKFRTFLLTSLHYFINGVIDKEKAERRGAGDMPVSLDETDSEGVMLHEPHSPAPPANLEYDKAWAQIILDNALDQLEKTYTDRGKSELYSALEPAMHDDETSSAYRKIAESFGMSEGAVKKAVYDMRAKLRKLIHAEIMQTVSTEADFKQELDYLISLFWQAKR
jgi:DNA-directed RNA polymerase specialized sigma24 family protein